MSEETSTTTTTTSAAAPQVTAPGLSNIARSTRTGIIPGSRRVSLIENTITDRSFGAPFSLNWSLLSSETDVVYEPSSFAIILKCKATKDDGTNITDSTITLSEEASSMVFDNLNIRIAGQKAFQTNSNEFMLTRHCKDRLYEEHDGKSTDDEDDTTGPLSYRQINPDSMNYSTVANMSNEGKFMDGLLNGGETFYLTVVLDNINIFGSENGFLPVVFPINIEARTLATPGHLFQCANSVTQSPKMTMVSAELEYYTRRLEPAAAQRFTQRLSSNSIVYTTTGFSAAQIGIFKSGSLSFSADPLSFESAFDQLMLFCIDEDQFIGATTPYKLYNRLSHSTNTIDEITISTATGELIKKFSELGSIPLTQRMFRELEIIYRGTNPIGRSTLVNPDIFQRVGSNVGDLAFYILSNDDIHSNGPDPRRPIQLRIKATAKSVLTSNTIMFACWKSTRQVNLSLRQGVSGLVL